MVIAKKRTTLNPIGKCVGAKYQRLESGKTIKTPIINLIIIKAIVLQY